MELFIHLGAVTPGLSLDCYSKLIGYPLNELQDKFDSAMELLKSKLKRQYDCVDFLLATYDEFCDENECTDATDAILFDALPKISNVTGYNTRISAYDIIFKCVDFTLKAGFANEGLDIKLVEIVEFSSCPCGIPTFKIDCSNTREEIVEIYEKYGLSEDDIDFCED